MADDWYAAVRDYRQRTGDEMRDVYLALLTFIGSRHPRVMAEAQRTLEQVYPDGIERAPEPGLPPRTCTCEPGQLDLTGHHHEGCPALDDR